MNIRKILTLLFFVALVFGCVTDESSSAGQLAPDDSVSPTEQVVEAEPIPAIEVSYHSLTNGEGVELAEIEAIDLYLRSELVNSPRVNISLDETDKALYGKVSKIGEKYLLVVNITDFANNKEIASYSEDFVSLHEFGFIVDSIIAKVEGRSLLQDGNQELISLNLSAIEVDALSEVELESLGISEIDLLMSQVDVSNSGVERMANLLNDRLRDCFALFNQEQYQSASEETEKFLTSFSNMTEDYQDALSIYKERAQRLVIHSDQRSELRSILSSLQGIAAIQEADQDPLAAFLRVGPLVDQLDKTWIDENQARELLNEANQSEAYYYTLVIQEGLNEVERLVESPDFPGAFMYFSDLESFHSDYWNRLSSSELNSIETMIYNGSRFLSRSYLSFAVSLFNDLIEDEQYDTAHRTLERGINSLITYGEQPGHYTPDLSDIEQTLADTAEICNKLAQSYYEEFKYNLNYYVFDGSAVGVRLSFEEYMDYFFISINQEEYAMDLAALVNQYSDMYDLSLDKYSRDLYDLLQEYENMLYMEEFTARIDDLIYSRNFSEINREIGRERNRGVVSQSVLNAVGERVEMAQKGFVLVRAGQFTMGNHVCSEPCFGSHDEETYSITREQDGVVSEVFDGPREVLLTQDFYISVTEVSQAEYRRVMGADSVPYRRMTNCVSYGMTEKRTNFTVGDNYPMTALSWFDALRYCNERSRQEGLTPCYNVPDQPDIGYFGDYEIEELVESVRFNSNANGYRLPTPEEWEYASLGGHRDDGQYLGYGLTNDAREMDWTLQTVQSGPVNELGIYHLFDNVAEWCWGFKPIPMRSDEGEVYDNGLRIDPIHLPFTGDIAYIMGGSFDYEYFGYNNEWWDVDMEMTGGPIGWRNEGSLFIMAHMGDQSTINPNVKRVGAGFRVVRNAP